MTKSKVYFGSIQQGQAHGFASLGAKLDTLLEHLDFSSIEKNDKVAVKMHLGFHDGYQTVPVFFVRRIVNAVKAAGGWPFVTDNPTAVYNAAERGYTQETCGCP
ncbi:MAG: 4Fe-4S ferredoxin, partial [Promethearchaeota archaeon]